MPDTTVAREIHLRALDVTRAWELLAHCENEFMPDDPGACDETQQALDEAILALMRVADSARWEQYQQWCRAGQAFGDGAARAEVEG